MQLNDLLNSYDINTELKQSTENQDVFDMFDGEFVGQCSPLFRWVGGKTQLLSTLKFYAPKKFDTYFEPFIGGGALLFSLMPKRAVLNDKNIVISNLYSDVQNNYDELVNLLKSVSKLPDTELVYMTVRDIYNEMVRQQKYTTELSALFMYLNAKAFNSLYRVNSKGEFNVGYRKDFKVPAVYTPETFKYAHDYFTNNQVTILSGDFLNCTKTAKAGDFVYFDPPYIPVSDTKNYTGYTKEQFTKQNQIELANEFKRLSDLGVYCMLSNSDSPLLYELYGSYMIKKLNVTYFVQPTSDDMRRQECLVMNY